MKSVESPITNSASALLFANQNPSVVSAADVLPLLITPNVALPVICTSFPRVLPTLRYEIPLLALPNFNVPSANDIECWVEDNCKSPVFASNSNLLVFISNELPEADEWNFKKSVSSPITNSAC